MAYTNILCLANSTKKGGRCIAGLRLDGQGWVRPVSRGGDGEIPLPTRTINGYEIQPLDIISIDLTEACPLSHQPENWYYQNPWKLITKQVPVDDSVRTLMRPFRENGPNIFETSEDRISSGHIQEHPARSSLTFVYLNELTINADRGYSRKQFRALFDISGSKYSLAITDPNIKTHYQDLQVGSNIKINNVIVVISLGELFNGDHYKLACTVLEIS